MTAIYSIKTAKQFLKIYLRKKFETNGTQIQAYTS